MAKKPDPYGTNGGNGGYLKRKPVKDAKKEQFNMSDAGKFAATGRTNKTKRK